MKKNIKQTKKHIHKDSIKKNEKKRKEITWIKVKEETKWKCHNQRLLHCTLFV